MVHKQPHDEFIPDLGKKIRNRVWDDMSEVDKVDYIRIQFILAIRKIRKLPDKASAHDELVQMAKYIRKPIYNSTELTFNEKGMLNTITIKWVTGSKMPQTKWGAIRALERRVIKCKNMLHRSYLRQRNEFLQTMGIRPVEIPSNEKLFREIFAPEIEDQQKQSDSKPLI
jgi:hypothetical protein